MAIFGHLGASGSSNMLNIVLQMLNIGSHMLNIGHINQDRRGYIEPLHSIGAHRWSQGLKWPYLAILSPWEHPVLRRAPILL